MEGFRAQSLGRRQKYIQVIISSLYINIMVGGKEMQYHTHSDNARAALRTALTHQGHSVLCVTPTSSLYTATTEAIRARKEKSLSHARTRTHTHTSGRRFPRGRVTRQEISAQLPPCSRREPTSRRPRHNARRGWIKLKEGFLFPPQANATLGRPQHNLHHAWRSSLPPGFTLGWGMEGLYKEIAKLRTHHCLKLTHT